ALSNALITTTNLVISANGVLTGSGTITAISFTNNGVIAPGNPAGCLAVNGKLTLLTNSLVAFELGGYSSGGTYDCVNVSDSVSLGGAFAVSFINGFEMAITNGASFTLLTAGSLSGAFTNAASGTHLVTADGFADFLVTYSGTSVVLSQARVSPRLVVN